MSDINRRGFLKGSLSTAAYAILHPEAKAGEPPETSRYTVVWDLAKAFRESTPTRERACINGMWRWQPGQADEHSLPAANWGYLRVPEVWPGSNGRWATDPEVFHPNARWAKMDLGAVTAAWYQREITVPGEWGGQADHSFR